MPATEQEKLDIGCPASRFGNVSSLPCRAVTRVTVTSHWNCLPHQWLRTVMVMDWVIVLGVYTSKRPRDVLTVANVSKLRGASWFTFPQG